LNFLKIALFFILTLVAFAEKVEITSDSMQAESLNHEIHFIGNAKVKQLKDWITADKIIVYFDDNNQTKMYKAIGNADFEFSNDKGHYLGNSKIVEYYPMTSVYVLIDKANVKDLLNKRTAKGDKITVDMLTGKSHVEGTKSKPVVFTLDMVKK
jgi:lipopolysaccharide export system protein LptA